MNIDRLKSLLSYDPLTGALKWKSRVSSAVPIDLTAGYVSQAGYVELMVGGKMFKGHRVAWALYYGRWPDGQLDHINGDREDIRIENLREVSPLENQRNRKRNHNNSSGVTGVRWRQDRCLWEVSIRVRGKLLQIGRYRSFDAAVSARKDAERLHGFHQNHGRAA